MEKAQGYAIPLVRRAALVVPLLAAAYVMVAAFPDLPIPASASLDGSWVVEINRIVHRGFGRNVVFTYGPLGFLLHPTSVGGHDALAAWLRFGALASLAAFALRRRAAPIEVAVFAFAQAAAVGFGLSFDYQIIVLLVLLGATAVEREDRVGVMLLVMLAALSGAALFIKFTLGVALVLVTATTCALRLRRDLTAGLPAVAFAAGAGIATLLALSAIFLATPGDVVPWIRWSVELSGGYSEAMTRRVPVPGADAFAAAGAVALIAVVGVGIWGWRRGSSAASIALLAAGPLFVAFKHSFVRQDADHVTVFPSFLLAIVGAAGLFASRRVERALVRAVVAVAAAGSLIVAIAYDNPDHFGLASATTPIPIARAFAGLRGAEALATWTSPATRRAAIEEDLSADALPGLARFAAGRKVGVIPWELAVCAASQVDCEPNATLQTYAAYTSDLDRLSAAHYLGAGAPGLVLLDDAGIDERTPPLDTPALWRALVGGYRKAAFQPPTGLLLERVAGALPIEPVALARTLAEPRRWIPVPTVQGPLYASIALEPTLRGRAERILFRVEPVFVAFRYGSGEMIVRRIVPSTARDGLPIDQLPTTEAELVGIFTGRPTRRPEAIALVGDGLDSFQQPVAISWLRGEVR